MYQKIKSIKVTSLCYRKEILSFKISQPASLEHLASATLVINSMGNPFSGVSLQVFKSLKNSK